MSENQNPQVQAEVEAYDNFEAAQVEEARESGAFTPDQIAIAQQDIADERVLVASGFEGAEEATLNVAGIISDDILGTDSQDTDSFDD